ncbi:hypothetical protein EDB85DRAFT_1586645 [Lactarius pseudohatsudake]|nr:hypothetical protein EDB85DRAFT_1586645 [Lactarius pseudohatsudake]
MTEDAMHALNNMLWTAYLMMVENDGLNERQLHEYARVDGWPRAFWFEEGVTMWLFWFLLRLDDYFVLDEAELSNATTILKLLALGAHEANKFRLRPRRYNKVFAFTSTPSYPRVSEECEPVSFCEFLKNRLHIRPSHVESDHYFRAVLLFQKWTVDMWAAAADSRLDWIQHLTLPGPVPRARLLRRFSCQGQSSKLNTTFTLFIMSPPQTNQDI